MRMRMTNEPAVLAPCRGCMTARTIVRRVLQGGQLTRVHRDVSAPSSSRSHLSSIRASYRGGMPLGSHEAPLMWHAARALLPSGPTRALRSASLAPTRIKPNRSAQA